MTNWYYFDATGKKCGPVDSGTLKTLAQHGIITPLTTIINDAGKGAVAGNIKGLEFPQNSVSQNQMPQNLSPTNTSYSLNTPPPVPKPASVPVPPIVQVVTPAVPNAASTPLEDTFSRLVNGNWVGAASNASTYYHPPKQNTGAMDEVAAYFLLKL